MMKIAYFSLMAALASSQLCNYYKPSIFNYHYPVGRCLQASIQSVTSFNDVMITCNGNGTITRRDYAANSGCTGAPSSTQLISTASEFRCGGTDCYIQYEYGSTSFSDTGLSLSLRNCTSRNPRVLIDAVPGLCADTLDTFYCGANGAYVAGTCSVTNSTAAVYLPFGQCNKYSSSYKIHSCMGGPAGPTGNYFAANSYTNCNFYNVNGTRRGVIDVCEPGFFSSTLARCTDANTLEVGSWFGTGCQGSPLTVDTYKKGDPMVDFLCTGNQCIVEQSSYSTSDCTGSVTKYSYAAGKCSGSNKYYCYGTNNNKIFRESYWSSSGFPGCPQSEVSTSGTVYDTGVCTSSLSSSSEMWSCSLTGATPPFGSVGAGHMVSLDVAVWAAALVAVFSI